MKFTPKKIRSFGFALILGLVALVGIPNLALAQAANTSSTPQPQAQAVRKYPSGYATVPVYYGQGYCYAPGYASGPQTYPPRGHVSGYGYWGNCGW